jgi:ADP-ribose pyrophosphatase YjhB (NUDIX family)
MGYAGSYTWRLRQFVGHETLMVPGISVILLDDEGRVLLQKRTDFGVWGLPSGSCEIGENVMTTVRREVKEETNLDVEDARLFGLYTGPDHTVQFPNGDRMQNFAVVFVVEDWSGYLRADNDEGSDVRFFSLSELPGMVPWHKEVLRDFGAHAEQVVVK